MNPLEIAGLVGLGLAAGFASGLLGIGGAVIIIPVLVLLFGFNQQIAQGTTLFLMIFPIGILAVMEYWKAGKVNVVAGLIIAITFILGGWLGGKLSLTLDAGILRKIFSVGLAAIAVRMFFE